MDIYTAELEGVNQSDIEAFLGLQRPIAQRPSEGDRFDFKEDVPQDIGKDVAAFANTYGGLIIIGVSPAIIQGKKTSTPAALVGIGGAEQKSRVTHMIRNSVYPVPVFDIVEKRLENDATKTVLILRVEPGDHPPYMFTTSKQIQIRRGDTNELVSLFELESLLERRKADADTLRAARASEIYVSQHPPEHRQPKPTRARNFQTISIIPWDYGQTRMDQNLERKVDKYIRCAFLRDRYPPLVSMPYKKTVRARFSEFERVDHDQLLDRMWRINYNGVVQFASSIRYDQPEIIGNLILDFFSALKVAELVFSDRERFGNVDIKSELTCIDSRMEMKTPVFGSLKSTPDELGGIHVGAEIPVGNQNHWRYDTTIQHQQLEQPVDIAASMFSEHLREIWQCEFSFDRLRDDIQVFWENQFVPNLPADIR